MAAVGLVLATLFAVRRWRPGLVASALTATLASAAVWPVVAVLAGDAPAGIYGALGLLLIATATIPALSTSDGSGRLAGPAAAPWSARRDQPEPLGHRRSLSAGRRHRCPGDPAGRDGGGGARHRPVAVGRPALRRRRHRRTIRLARRGLVGPPAGVGLVPDRLPHRAGGDAPAAWSLACSRSPAPPPCSPPPAGCRRPSGLGIGGPTAIIVGVAAAGLPWPAVPAVTLLLGLALSCWPPSRRWGRVRTVVTGRTGRVLPQRRPGRARWPMRWSTIAGPASIVVVAAVIGAVGRTIAWRTGRMVPPITAALAWPSRPGWPRT